MKEAMQKIATRKKAMRLVVAPDSFKGSLSAAEAAEAIERGIIRVFPVADTVLIPLADGGEGTMDSLLMANGGEKVRTHVSDPLGRPIEAAYARLQPGHIAVIEMASASGLTLLATDERNPLLTSTYGTGQLIKKALDDGCREFIITLGGSATNDGGAGMLQALGMRLLDRHGHDIRDMSGGKLHLVHTIEQSAFDPRIAQSRFTIAADVQNPLLGPDGATHMYAPQKGADAAMVEQLEHNMAHWANVLAAATGHAQHDVAGRAESRSVGHDETDSAAEPEQQDNVDGRHTWHTMPGAGAAGGCGAALLAFFPAQMQRGIDIVLQHARIEERLKGASFVITGEGRIDAQTTYGKTVLGIAQAAKKQGIPTIAIAGTVDKGSEWLYEHGVVALHSIINRPLTVQEAMINAADLLQFTAEQIARTAFYDYFHRQS